jgi:hypothetical protein
MKIELTPKNKKNQKNGAGRFDFYLNQLEKLLVQATTEKNPALWLYQNNARTTLFMLEGLSKLYSGLHNKKTFSKLDEHFKLLEDTLGAIDYYDAFAKEFSANTKIPATITAYAQAQTRENIQRFNDLLVEKKWLGENAERTRKIRKKLGKVEWLKEKDEIKAIEDFYRKQIEEINAFEANYPDGFTELETQVHALRRKLRWLSIYPQILRGSIQLRESEAQNEAIKKYLTPEIVSSPFNKMPDAGTNQYFLMLDKNRFFALSWLISELGKLKDNGLRIVLLTEAFEQTKNLSPAEAEKQTFSFLAPNSLILPGILAKASEICKTYFAEQNLDKLLDGIEKVKVE